VIGYTLGRRAREQPVAVREDIMKVVVDLNICNLHGLCVETAPEVFEIGDDGVLHVLNERPPDGLRAKVDRAVRECPTGAISIER
jgi:ferredoxin